MKVYLNINKLINVCVLFLAIISGLAIYQSDSTLGNSDLITVIKFLSYVLVFISVIGLIITKADLNVGCFIPLIYFAYTNINTYNQTNISGFLGASILLILFLVPNESKYEILRAYRIWLIIMAVFGIVAYFAYTLNLSFIPFVEKDYYSLSFQAKYVDYTFAYLFKSINGNELRLCGLFNEPGYFGTIIALTLCVDKINLKHIGNWILLIAGILTYSLAFFIITLTYIILICIKNKYVMILLLAILIFYFFILPNVVIQNESLAFVFERIKFVDGKFMGDNRSNDAVDNAFKELIDYPLRLFFGYGKGYTATITSDDFSTFKMYIIDYGYFGFLLIFGFLFLYSILQTKKNWFAVAFVIVFFLSVYQRPNIYTTAYFILLLNGTYALANDIALTKKLNHSHLLEYSSESCLV